MPTIVGVAAVDFAAAWFLSRSIPIRQVGLNCRETLTIIQRMLRLGLVFMWNGVVMSLVGWLTLVWITQKFGLQATGIASVAIVISGYFVSFVTGAMATDFYPRLATHEKELSRANSLINEQVEVGLILALPGLLAIIAFAPWIIRLFYSETFLPAAVLLQWFAFGCLGRVIAWPLTYLMPALGKPRLYFLFETIINGLHLALIYMCLSYFGLNGIAVAFLVLQPFYLLTVCFVARHLSAFRWNGQTLRVICMLLPQALLTLVLATSLPLAQATMAAGLLTIVTSTLCLRLAVRRIDANHRVIRALMRIPCLRRICGLEG